MLPSFPPIVRLLTTTLGVLALAAGAVACANDKSSDAMLATRSTDSGEISESSLSPATQKALDDGNEAYRAGNYDSALTHYSIAAQSDPTAAAPYYGILMAAQKLGNRTLADSASAMIQRLSGEDPGAHSGSGGNIPPAPHGAGRNDGSVPNPHGLPSK